MRYGKVFGLYEKIQPLLKYSLPVEEKLPAKNILVLAPHPDDEAIGCGGALYAHCANGGRATVVFCTSDGAQREAEAAEALKVLGVSDSLSFGYAIETLKSQSGFAEKIAGVIESKKPEIVFIPFFMDNHEDHRAVNSAFAKSHAARKADFMVYAYPVWFPLYPNVLMDIGKAWEHKKKAIECYKTQLATRDYVKMAKALGDYWGEVKGHGMKTAESFFRATAGEYCSAIKKVLG